MYVSHSLFSTHSFVRSFFRSFFLLGVRIFVSGLCVNDVVISRKRIQSFFSFEQGKGGNELSRQAVNRPMIDRYNDLLNCRSHVKMLGRVEKERKKI